MERRHLATLPDPTGRGAGEEGAGLHDVSVGFRRAVEQARERASAEYLEQLMRHFHGNVTRAAAQAGMTRESLHRVLRQYRIRSDDYRATPGAVDADEALSPAASG